MMMMIMTTINNDLDAKEGKGVQQNKEGRKEGIKTKTKNTNNKKNAFCLASSRR
jgi:hypothetical protein